MGSATWGPPREIIHGLQALYGPRVFVETGTFLGETAAWAATCFDRVFTIEASAELHAQASGRHARLGNVSFLQGESQAQLADVVAKLDQPALFWLDAHWSGGPTWGQERECPLLEEIAIIEASAHDHLILIDDARLFLAPPPAPHRPEQWPDIGQVSVALAAIRPRRVAVIEDVIVAVPEHCGNDWSRFLQFYLRRHPAALSAANPAPWAFTKMDLIGQFRRHAIRPRGVVHIGAHLGQELPLYLRMGFERALLVEANPKVFADLEKRARELLRGRPERKPCQVELAPYAISDANGEVEFRVNANAESSSLLPLKGHLELFPKMVEVERIRVPARTLDTLLEGTGAAPGSFNFLNIDVQGAELLVLSGGERTLSQVDAVCSEINFSELYAGCALAWQLDDLLGRHGFERVATHHPHRMEWGDAFYVKTIKVTAIVSTYDSADLFVGRMENLVGQSLFARGRLEIIVIDSASPGNERALVKPFVDRHPDRIRYVRTPTRETIYAAWNRAIEMARGEYITTQNVDDRMKQDGLERLARHLDAHPECVLVCGDQERVARGAVFDVESLYRRHWNFVPFSRPRLLFNTQVGSQPMWRTRAHYLAGYFDPAMAAVGDREFYLRLSRHGQFQYIPEVLGSLDYADISLSRSGDAVDLEGHLIIDRCLANKGLADLLGYPVAAEDDELARQVFRNNLCCELAHHFAACRVAWSARGLANMREILASVAGVDGHAAVVAANLARVKACLGADGEAVAAAARLRLEVIAWPPSATVTVGQAE